MDILWGIIALCYSHPDMTKDFVMFAIAAGLVYRLFSKHFQKVTDGLTTINKTIADLSIAMSNLETNHSARIGRVEEGQKKLEEKVNKFAGV